MRGIITFRCNKRQEHEYIRAKDAGRALGGGGETVGEKMLAQRSSSLSLEKLPSFVHMLRWGVGKIRSFLLCVNRAQMLRADNVEREQKKREVRAGINSKKNFHICHLLRTRVCRLQIVC